MKNHENKKAALGAKIEAASERSNRVIQDSTVKAAKKKIFSPLPARALLDPHLSGLQFRLLGAVALYDRLGKNGQGCWVGHEALSEIAGCAYTRVSMELGYLKRRGYISSERHKTNRRRQVYRVIYNEADAFQNSSPNGEPSLSSTVHQTANLPASIVHLHERDSSPIHRTTCNGNSDLTLSNRKKIAETDEAEALRDSAEAAYVASDTRFPSPLEAENVGRTLAILERRLQEGDGSLLTEEVGNWLSDVQLSDEYDSPNAGRAYRLLNEYEFPDGFPLPV